MSSIPTTGTAASLPTPVSWVESAFDQYFQAASTCCAAAAAARPAPPLATRFHQVCQTTGVLAEVAEELHRLDARGVSLDPAELRGIYNISQEVARQLRSIRASAALQRAALREPRHKRKRSPRSPRQCVKCHYTKTPVWRDGPQGPRSLCNPCGLLYAKKLRAAAAARK